MTLARGVRLGPYEIVGALGAGGMGEVYRARDLRLKRDVAVKVLPQAFLIDADRLARFQREAELLAAISHPNIAAIYGLEESGDLKGLILELVEGETLADRIHGRAMPVLEALNIARQIAEAIDAAHEKGIVHRDLKPANIKITPLGQVKVLDFGLAKGSIDGDVGHDVSHAPTVTIDGTEVGVIFGTAAYMSPEQARGKPLDKRTDIWSFGCVLYEMLTGRSAFRGETVSDTIATIIAREPDWSALPEDVPAAVERLLRRCLEKEPQQRLRDIGDIRLELVHLLSEGTASSRVGRIQPDVLVSISRRRGRLIVASVLVLVLAAIAGVMWIVSPTRSAGSSVVEPPLQLTDLNDSAVHPAISPDGRMLTFIRGGNFGDSAQRGGQIYVKFLPNGAPVQLTRDQYNKEQPVFSPDGSRIVYTAVTEGFRWDSWQVPVLGGAPKPFLANASGLVWLDERQMLYSEIMSGIHMGIVTSTDSRANHRAVYYPRIQGGMAHRSALSPDGKSLLIVEMDGGSWMPCRLMPFDGSSLGRQVAPPEAQCTTAAWSPDGKWMYFSSNAGGGFHIWRQRYPDGAPEQVTSGPTEQEGTAITQDGKYLITSMGIQQASVWLHDANGDRQLTSEGYALRPTRVGDRVFYLVRSSSARAFAGGELWAIDVATGDTERMLPGRVMSGYSIAHDGRRVVFTSVGESGGDGVWVADLDRRTAPRQLTRDGEFRAFYGSPGEIVYISQGTERHLYRMKEDGSDKQLIPTDPVNNLFSVSPDGRWALALLLRPSSEGGGTYMQLISMRGENPVTFCNTDCAMGFGPVRLQAPPVQWSADGSSLLVSLQYVAPRRTGQTVVLPYRSDVPLQRLWPKGLQTEEDIVANPGAKIIPEANVFAGARSSEYLVWRRTTASNVYRIPLPN